MTTIVYRDGVMAADSRAFKDKVTGLGVKVKIRRLKDGRLVGCSTGQIGVPEAVLDWFETGMPNGADGLKALLALVTEPGFQLLAVSPQGKATYMVGHGLPTHAAGPDYAIGSGEDYAMGALACGKAAVEACAIACRFDAYSEPPIYAATHDQDPKEYGPLRQADTLG